MSQRPKPYFIEDAPTRYGLGIVREAIMEISDSYLDSEISLYDEKYNKFIQDQIYLIFEWAITAIEEAHYEARQKRIEAQIEKIEEQRNEK